MIYLYSTVDEWSSYSRTVFYLRMGGDRTSGFAFFKASYSTLPNILAFAKHS